MKQDILYEIKKAEEESVKIIEKATKEAENVIVSAKHQVDSIIETANKHAKEATEKKIEESKEGVEEEKQVTIAKGKKSRENLKKNTKKKIDSTIKLFLRKFDKLV
jgi:V/A-type H+/Na+-transporting ATPase subunit G/H